MSKTDNPLVSVIVPVYNAEAYINESLSCIVSQSIKDIEIIIIDDGNNDKTVDILHQYADSDSRIKIIQSGHKGAAIARNIGLGIARGEYLSFLDADDIFDAQMLEKSYLTAKKHNSDIVVFQYRELNMLTGHMRRNCEAARQAAENNNTFSTGIHILREASPVPWNKLFRREFIEEYGLQFQDLTSCNDFAFTKCALLVAKRVHFLREELITYRRHGQSISSTRYKNASNIVEAGKEVLSFIKRHFPDQNIEEFYKLMLFHCAHEYRIFPTHEDTRPFLKKALALFPLWYRIKFIRKITTFRIRQKIRRLFHV